jgi:outer membrane protein W
MMTRILNSAAALLLAFAAGTSVAAAQTSLDLEAGTFMGGTFFLKDAGPRLTIQRQDAGSLLVQDGEFRNGVTVGWTAGLRFGDRFGVEGQYALTPTRLVARQGLEPYGGSVDASSHQYGATLRYHLSPVGRIRPFVGAGVVGETLTFRRHLAWQRQSDWAGTLLAGGEVQAANGIALRANVARDLIGRAKHLPLDHVMITAGVNVKTPLR